MLARSPNVLTTLAGLRCFLDLIRSQHADAAKDLCGGVGLVPTMGALHHGHLSLINQARKQNQWVIVSIFVNPLQFGPNEDFSQYPRTLEQDQALCHQAGVDAIFAPTAGELFSGTGLSPTQVLPPEEMLQHLCAPHRPGHFQGVATIVTRLLQLVQPQHLYLGEKDAQQLAILRRVISDLHLPGIVVACPTQREASGLAYSSRNAYLSSAERQQAATLYRSLQQAQQLFQAGRRSRPELLSAVTATLASEPALELEYAELAHPQTLQPLKAVEQVGLLAIAARLGRTRLIDNLLLDARRPILAIDGPAGAGKSTVTRLSAQALGLFYLDTGAMYRAVTWLVLQAGIDPQDQVAVAELVGQSQIQLLPLAEGSLRVLVNAQDVTQEIRSQVVTARVSEIAAQPAVRQVLVQQQQRYGQQGGVAMEGRDIGTHVFPEAGLKIFLTASPLERARRRQQELQRQGVSDLSLEQLEQMIRERDYKDSHRAYAPFRKASDAIEVITDGLTISEVVSRIVSLYRNRFPHLSQPEREVSSVS